ncbi:hypothetical protein R75461_07192 [Paraburkholderia nemoris]|uniref:type VI secretion system contractile sheath small subunit n=1 Tax=Paraburkholderia nemoris TaxID=2793076 RepID=UPI00190DE582|nr:MULTISPECIES: type VI secretion system contractile sheath small subunit [Paraburkholderia]MBK3786689.1 type VI secretion system contractile sheath small subunit [Paraburkholderia aspalathi]CAE6844728.1 hypothetical protein R75461_07192 [Paraburkholderia nemoris]
MSEFFQNEVPRARVNIKLDLHTDGAQKKVELLVMGDYSNGQDNRPLAERAKVDINKNNFNAVLGEYRPKAKIAVENTMASDGSELPVDLEFTSMDDFRPEVVASKVPELRALMAACNLLRDLKSNLLDNATFRRELEKILRDPAPSERLRADLQQIGQSTASAQ